MGSVAVDRLIEQLSAGFDALQDEYQKLFGRHSILERKLATAREQYNELAKLYRTDETATPPLSLISSPGNAKDEGFAPRTAAEILDRSSDEKSRRAANKIRTAIIAANGLRHAVPELPDAGVKIWSGPAADNPDASSSMMPSIAESPLEQDFTVEGKPSQLGCPFASMARKKLSSHAASVLSRYERTGSGGSVATASTPPSNTSASRVNGRESFSKRRSRRASMVDPIKAEICGLSDHSSTPPQQERAASLVAPSKGPTQIENAEVGVCPIRFLDQHSPEEVATYFEKHKHELPRSHEVCVMRYQSNEEQIKELDAKYGNLVSMIQGLGKRHKEMLPEDILVEDEEDEGGSEKALSDEKIRKWASSVSAQAPEAAEGQEEEGEEERLPHFDRPVRDIRVGESPSRPWGIHVPAKYGDAEDEEVASDKPAHAPARIPPPQAEPRTWNAAATPSSPEAHKDSVPNDAVPKMSGGAGGKCPFDHNAMKNGGAGMAGVGAAFAAMGMGKPTTTTEPVRQPVEAHHRKTATVEPQATPAAATQQPTIVINGPVFFGYSPEDTIRILKESGLKIHQQQS